MYLFEDIRLIRKWKAIQILSQLQDNISTYSIYPSTFNWLLTLIALCSFWWCCANPPSIISIKVSVSHCIYLILILSCLLWLYHATFLFLYSQFVHRISSQCYLKIKSVLEMYEFSLKWYFLLRRFKT